MNQALTLSDILQIEDTKEITSIYCEDTGIPLWTAIREPFLRMVLGDAIYGVPLIASGREGGLKPGLRRIATISRSFVHNALHYRHLDMQYPIVLMSTGARLVKHERLYFNNLSDYFRTESPRQTLSIEDVFEFKWPFPRVHNNLLLHTPLRVEGVLRGRLRKGQFQEPAKALVDLVKQRARDLIGWEMGDARGNWLERICTSGASSFLPRYQAYKLLFVRAGARLLIKEEACYGGADNASAILAAKSLGMVTAEYQHGSVSPGHIAYNFASAVSSDEVFQKTLPEYFLSYGSWWGEQINAPIKKVAIGSPHRTEMLGVSLTDFTQCQQVLILGDGIETKMYLEFCERLTGLLGGAVGIVFRPHPLERSTVLAEHPDGFFGNVRIDINQDIYSSFRTALAVVSEVSTGLFEAIGLVPKVFIWDTPKARFGYPVHPFHGFSDVNELARLLLDDNAGRVDAHQIDSIWAPNWQKNYLGFIERALHQ